jgi:hypothetical protein
VSVDSSVDQILGLLTKSFLRQADDLLDLYSAALTRSRPGHCVVCYFKLHGVAELETLLYPLKTWIEANIEVVAKDAQDIILEQLPLKLDASNLEAYCQDVIHEFRTNRVYPSPNLTLEFCFKEAA